MAKEAKTTTPSFHRKYSIDAKDDETWESEVFSAFGHSWYAEIYSDPIC
jgi:hypothetical protein